MEQRAPELRQAAQAMRDDHGPDHERHDMWKQMATWLDCVASQFEQGGNYPFPSVPLMVAHEYMQARGRKQ